MNTKHHMCLSVRGALRNWNKLMLKNMFLHDDGRKCSAEEATDILLDELSKGHDVIPLSAKPCEGFDYKKGCPGHPVEEEKEEEKK